MLAQGAGFWQAMAGAVVLIYGLLVRYFMADPLGIVPAQGFLSYVPMILGVVLLTLGVLRINGK